MHPSTTRIMKRSFTQMIVQGQLRAGIKQVAARPTVSHFSTAVHYPSADDKKSQDPENGTSVSHFMLKRIPKADDLIWENPIPHAVYNLDEIEHIEKTHHDPKKLHEKAALVAVKALRTGFDVMSGYRGPGGAMTERDWLNRCLFLETVAGVPGMVAGMVRHLRSLRAMRRDYGWIHTLLEEAENERMHLLIFMNMKQPGWIFRLGVLGAQGVFFNAFFLTYLVSPRTCHRFVGYLEEEAVKTYTGLLKDIEDGHVEAWNNMQAPLIARNYYKLPEDAQVLDMIKCIRADEANHRDVNHTFASLDQKNGVNPFVHGH
uniref:Alternative oxidase n=1 Tax=Globisporangium ultimum (strain ATCC 200006 / CBS 805.95 / DAOM BR144) TaxID=431595 RepID=K3WC84_GLOUD